MRTRNPSRASGVLVTLAVCMALLWAGFSMFQPLFALRFESFGAGVQALSAGDMAYALAFAVAAPVLGMLADRLGRRPVLLAALAGYLLVLVGYRLAASTWLLILLRGLAGVFAASVLPSMVSIVGDVADHDRRGQWIGIVNGGAAVGFIVGPPLGGLLYERLGYAVASLVAIGIAAAALLLAVFRIRETHKPAVRPGGRHRPWRQEWRGLPGRSTLLLVMVLTFGVMFAYAFAQPQFMFYAYDDLSLTSSQLGLVMGAYGLSYMAGAFALGRLSDRVGRKPVLALGLVLFAAQFAGLIVFHEVSWIVVSFIIAGMGNALYDPPLSALILDSVPPERSASLLGLKSTAGSIGSTLGPALVVLLAPSMKPQVGFLAATALVAILVLVSALLPHPGRRAEAAAQL